VLIQTHEMNTLQQAWTQIGQKSPGV